MERQLADAGFDESSLLSGNEEGVAISMEIATPYENLKGNAERLF